MSDPFIPVDICNRDQCDFSQKKNQLVCARRPAHLRMQTNFSNSKYFSKIAIIKSLTITNYSFIKSITTTRKNHSQINPSHIYTYIVIYTHIFEKTIKKIRPRSRTPPPAGVWSGRPRRRLLWPEGAPLPGLASPPLPGPGRAAPAGAWPCRAAARRAWLRLPPDLATPSGRPSGRASPPAGFSHARPPPARPGRTSRRN